MKWEFLNTPEERHILLIGFFSWLTGQKIWQNDEELKGMVMREFWYYGLGRFLFAVMIGGLVLWTV